MKLPTQIIKRFPIRKELDSYSDSLYIDTDRNGSMTMDGLTTREPLLDTDTVEELSNQIEKNPQGLVTVADCEFDMGVECREEEWEGSDSYQYQHLGSLCDFARRQAPEDLKESATWAVSLGGGASDEMEFIILA